MYIRTMTSQSPQEQYPHMKKRGIPHETHRKYKFKKAGAIVGVTLFGLGGVTGGAGVFGLTIESSKANPNPATIQTILDITKAGAIASGTGSALMLSLWRRKNSATTEPKHDRSSNSN